MQVLFDTHALLDRMLLAQARAEGLSLLTHDDAIAAYGDGVVAF